VLRLQGELRSLRWAPKRLRTFCLRDPKPRLIAASAFRDRVVHHALCAALAPTWHRRADPGCFACLPGRGPRAAVLAVQRLTRRHPWFLKLDVQRFFETAQHEVLLRVVRRDRWEPQVEWALARILEGGAHRPGVGLPIGSLTSQHLGNLLLGELDHFARHKLRVPGWVRYRDDLIAFGPDQATLQGWHSALGEVLEQRLGQRLKPSATRLARCELGVPFLGYRIWRFTRRLDGARRRRLIRWVRSARAPERVASAVDWAHFGGGRQLVAGLLRRRGLRGDGVGRDARTA
jgi:retron-type reverse transcriptase